MGMGFNIHVEIMNLNFKELNNSRGYSLKKMLITILSKILCGRVALFQLEKYWLVYWINVRELP